jgi:hypothetical protein
MKINYRAFKINETAIGFGYLNLRLETQMAHEYFGFEIVLYKSY